MTVAKFWDPSTQTWLNVQGGPTQAAFDALQTRVDALEVAALRPVYITPVVVINQGIGSSAFQTLSIAAQTGADTAKFAYLGVRIGGVASSGSFHVNSMTFRRTGSSGPTQYVELRVAGGTVGGGYTDHIWLPLNASEQFDWSRTDGMASSSSFIVTLEGYGV